MADENPLIFRVNGKDYAVPDKFTVGEMCDAERYFGVDFGEKDTSSGIRMASAMLWIAVRREDPSVTVDDIRALPPEVFDTLLKDPDARPPESNGDSSEKNGSSGTASALVGAQPAPARSPTGVPN